MIAWTDGDAYEALVGRWSRLVAPEFLKWLAVPPGAKWLDVGSGTGALTQAILSTCDPSHVDAYDLSRAFVEIACRTTVDGRATFGVADASSLPCPSASYDAVVAGLALNAVQDQPRMTGELARAAKPGGWVGVYVWDFDDKMQMLRFFWKAVASLDPGAETDDRNARFAICKPDRLEGALRETGLRSVEVKAIDVPTLFRDFDDYWAPFLRGNAPSQSYVASLNPEKREALRKHLKASLPTASDGSIDLVARAWAGKGKK
jgi:SAM-dependent methyltransferase